MLCIWQREKRKRGGRVLHETTTSFPCLKTSFTLEKKQCLFQKFFFVFTTLIPLAQTVTLNANPSLYNAKCISKYGIDTHLLDKDNPLFCCHKEERKRDICVIGP